MNLLFLGDSITDCDHCFTPDNLGNGFVRRTAKLLEQKGVTARVVNGGADGFTLPRIYRKWLANYSGQRYDTAVILGGINEVGMVMEADCQEEDRREYLKNSGAALERLLLGLAADGCGKILVLEPFLFSSPAFLRTWLPCLEETRQVIMDTIRDARRGLHSPPGPEARGLIRYLPTQGLLDQEANRLGPGAITADGIHLTSAGHECLARLLIKNL